ncbi:hypothetical protein ACTVJH_10250 [Desulfoplanes sp. PS50]|jgi:ABC-type uncharacterized transport system ATPase subunit
MPIQNLHSLLLDHHPRLLVIGHKESLTSELVSWIAQSQDHIGILGDDFPFLSNLSVMENIVLGTMYRQNISLEKACAPIREHIHALELGKWMNQRKEHLDSRTMVLCQLLRSISGGNSIVLLPSPAFTMAETVIQAIETLRHPLTVWIACNEKDAVTYDRLGFSTFYLEG